MQHVHRIYLAAFLLDAAVMVGTAALPFFVFHHLGGGATETGILGSSQSMVYALCCLASSTLVSRVKNAIAWAIFGGLIFGTLYAAGHLSRDIWVYGLGVSLASVGMSMVWPALHSWLGAEVDVAKRTRRMGMFNISWSLGLAVGPLIGGYLYEVDYRLPFVAVFLMSAAAAWILRPVPPETPHEPAPDTEEVPRVERHALERLIHPAWVANGMGWALVGVTRSVFPKQLDTLVSGQSLRLFWEAEAPQALVSGAAQLSGLLAFILSFSSCAMFLLMGRTHWWHGRSSVLFTLQVLSAGALAVLGATHSYALMGLCFALIGVNCGVCFFAASFYCTANPVLKHRRLAINEGVVGMGGFLAPFAFGWLADEYGFAAAFQYAPVLVAGLLAIQVGMLLRART